MNRFLKALRRNEQGLDFIEYALMAGFVAVAAGAAMPRISSQIAGFLNKIKVHLTAAFAG